MPFGTMSVPNLQLRNKSCEIQQSLDVILRRDGYTLFKNTLYLDSLAFSQNKTLTRLFVSASF